MALPSSRPGGPTLRHSLWGATRAAALLDLARPAMGLSAPADERPHRADPLNAQAVVPPVRHRSALASYRRLSETPVGDWRDANDAVSKIGGWRGYAREARAPASAPAGTVPK
jgi:hypothetical protein